MYKLLMLALLNLLSFAAYAQELQLCHIARALYEQEESQDKFISLKLVGIKNQALREGHYQTSEYSGNFSSNRPFKVSTGKVIDVEIDMRSQVGIFGNDRGNEFSLTLVDLGLRRKNHLHSSLSLKKLNLLLGKMVQMNLQVKGTSKSLKDAMKTPCPVTRDIREIYPNDVGPN